MPVSASDVDRVELAVAVEVGHRHARVHAAVGSMADRVVERAVAVAAKDVHGLAGADQVGDAVAGEVADRHAPRSGPVTNCPANG